MHSGSVRLALPGLALAFATSSCSCGGDGDDRALIVSDCFFQAGATGSSDEAIERIHPYVEVSQVNFDVEPRAWFIDLEQLRVTSSDEAVFQVASSDVVDVGFFASKKVLKLVISTFNGGDADMIFKNVAGETIDQRSLRVVVPDAIRLDIPISVPSIEDPEINLSALRIGDLGADLIVSYLSAGERAFGVSSTLQAVGPPLGLSVTTTGNNAGLFETSLQPHWNVLHLPPSSTPYVVDFTVSDTPLGRAQILGTTDIDVATADFVRRQNLVDYLDDHADFEVPSEVRDAIESSDDPKIICGKDNACVAKIDVKDAEGRAMLGAPITWDLGPDDLPEDTESRNGDLLLFTRSGLGFGHVHDVTATLNGISQTLTIDAEPNSVRIASSTEASCAQMGTQTTAGGLGLLLLLRRRRCRT